jgi:hypothetical protein
MYLKKKKTIPGRDRTSREPTGAMVPSHFVKIIIIIIIRVKNK